MPQNERRDEPRIGMIGVGAMGRPMVVRLLAEGRPVSFYARRPEVVDDVSALGARPLPSVGAVAEASGVVIVCVFSDDEVLDVCLGPAGVLAFMRPGTTLINHTTGSPTTATRIADEAGTRSVRFLDAALSGGPATIEAGRLALLIGGDASVLDEVRPVLSAYSDPITHVGGVGDGQRVKLINNAVFAANIVLAGEIERLAAQLGVAPTTALQAITHCSGDSFSLRMVAAMGSAHEAWQRAGKFIRKRMGRGMGAHRLVAEPLWAHLCSGAKLAVVVDSAPAALDMSITDTTGQAFATARATDAPTRPIELPVGRVPATPANPTPEGLRDRTFSPLTFLFDADRDLAFTEGLEDGPFWRQRGWAHPAWMGSASNAIVKQNVAFPPPGHWVHAGLDLTLHAPIPNGSQITLSGAVEALFDRRRYRFATAALVAQVDGRPVASMRNTFAYAAM